MTRHAPQQPRSPIGVMPIALVLALWQAIAASGIAPPSLLPPPARGVRAADRSRLGSTRTISITPRSRSIPAVRRLRDRGRHRRDARRRRDRQPGGRGHRQAAGARAGAGAEGRALSGDDPDRSASTMPPRSRWSRPTPRSRSCSPPTRAPSAVEPKLVWSARAAGTSPPRGPVQVVLTAALPSVLTGCRIGLDHLVHRGVPGRDDHLDRRARLSAGARGAQLSRPSTCSCR